LFDYRIAMEEVGKVYCHITGNKFSKPNTLAGYVIDVYEEELQNMIKEVTEELKNKVNKMKKYYPCMFCSCGHVELKYIYTSNDRNDLYRGKCDICKAEFEISKPVEKQRNDK